MQELEYLKNNYPGDYNYIVGVNRDGIGVGSKTVATGGDMTKQFTFTVTLSDQDGTPLVDPFAYTKSDATVGTIVNGGAVYLANGGSVTFTGLPDGTQYSIHACFWHRLYANCALYNCL